MSTYIVPQYDSNGLDSGLWIMYHNDEPLYENLSLFIDRGSKISAGQFPDWDNETYTEDGCIDAEHVKLCEFVGPNPYQDDDAAEYLRMHLAKTNAVVID